MPAGQGQIHGTRLPFRWVTRPDGSQYRRWPLSTNPLLLFFCAFFGSMFAIIAFASPDPTSRQIFRPVTAVCALFLLQGLIRVRRALQRAALEGLARTDTSGPDASAQMVEQENSDVSSGSWFTWRATMLGALLIGVFSAAFFTLGGIVWLGGTLGDGQGDPNAGAVAAVAGVPLLASVAFFLIGRHRQVALGTYRALPARGWAMLIVFDAVVLMECGLVAVVVPLAVITQWAGGHGFDRGASLSAAFAVVVLAVGGRFFKPMSDHYKAASASEGADAAAPWAGS